MSTAGAACDSCRQHLGCLAPVAGAAYGAPATRPTPAAGWPCWKQPHRQHPACQAGRCPQQCGGCPDTAGNLGQRGGAQPEWPAAHQCPPAARPSHWKPCQYSYRRRQSGPRCAHGQAQRQHRAADRVAPCRGCLCLCWLPGHRPSQTHRPPLLSSLPHAPQPQLSRSRPVSLCHWACAAEPARRAEAHHHVWPCRPGQSASSACFQDGPC